ncbi:peptidase [Propionigenium maris DSM 9537]|uniref:Peptidase n=1 Tax=Propionigenium maris DSM 9537 TaxID=1123000 RepID=A0A9W6LNJ2_9FUSO|nr:P1 family peptidase [Propionigenium maris]GLI56944.1 peptidase [Propionigenium maris DSM 9537]
MNPNDIFKIKGVKIGQAENDQGLTGVTAIIFEEGAVAGVDVRGAAPGTRETDLLKPENMVQKVHAIVLSGGSAFGLDSMTGVVRYLEEQKIGFDVEVACVPIVTGAVLFDLAIGDPTVRPDASLGYEAAKKANNSEFLEGNHGAGMGATVGKIRGTEYSVKSGIGSYTITLDDGLIVSAVVAVNAWGDVVEGDQVVAGTLNDDKKTFADGIKVLLEGEGAKGFEGRNTTIGAIVTNAVVDKAQAGKVAQMAHDGYGRAINPVHTMYDGDTIFAAGTGEVEADVNLVGIAAAEAMERAIRRAVRNTEGLGGYPSLKELKKK